MALAFGMPSLGHTMEKGKIIEWLKHEGDTVAKGEPLVIIETDKVITEVESPTAGVVLKIVVEQDKNALSVRRWPCWGMLGKRSARRNCNNCWGRP